MSLREAAQQALEALEFMADEWGFTQKANRPERWKAISALQAALEQYDVPLFTPHEVTPPGATLRDLMEERDWKQRELAHRLGRPVQAVNEILAGKKEITEDTALELERVMGVPAQFWLAREAQYREHLSRQRSAEVSREQEPVAWIQSNHLQLAQRGPFSCRVEPTQRHPDFVPLYTHPPRREWRGLSEEEINAEMPYCHNEFDLAEFKDFARAIEAKLKERNA